MADLPVCADPLKTEAFRKVFDGFWNVIAGVSLNNVTIPTDRFYGLLDPLCDVLVEKAGIKATDMLNDFFDSKQFSFVGILVSVGFTVRDYANGINTAIDIFDGLRDFMNLCMSGRYSAYWDMYRYGYIEQYELLGLTGCRTMYDFYKKAGLPESIKDKIRQYEGGALGRSALVSATGLNNFGQISSLMGSSWTAIDNAASNISGALGSNITFTQASNILSDVTDVIMQADIQDREDLVAALEAIDSLYEGGITANDVLSLSADYLVNEVLAGEGENSTQSALLTPSSVFVASSGVTNMSNLVPTPLELNKLAVDTLTLAQTRNDLICEAPRSGTVYSNDLTASFAASPVERFAERAFCREA